MRPGRVVVVHTAALLLGVLPIVFAHGPNDMDMDMGSAPAASSDELADEPPNYFRHPHYAGWMGAHIALMIVGWVFVMPVALSLSFARSRYYLPAQVVFHIVNGMGVFTSFVYNHATPDLYKNNSHHPIGWIVTSFTSAWTLMSLYVAYGEYKSKAIVPGRHAMTAQAMAKHNWFHRYTDQVVSRHSRDSGQGTERNSASLYGSRQHSQDSVHQKREAPESPGHEDELGVDSETEPERNGLLGSNRVDRFISRSVRRFATPRASKVVRFGQIVLEALLLLLGFLGITTGFVVYGGIFRDRQVFSGLAHWIKGGIFFWYGLLTLGRWMGAFTELGWAWNVRPQYPLVARWKARMPSAEFVESFTIWTYGASNVFLEHLNNWGKEWSNQDFEHVSLTLLFFGGGLLGMLVESSWARELMNTTVELQKEQEAEIGSPYNLTNTTTQAVQNFENFANEELRKKLNNAKGHHTNEGGSDVSRFHASAAAEEPDQLWAKPATHKTSLNPLPALVIMLLGIMMSSHHQDSMVSTMMHAQWGTLFCGFAIARAVTYITLYIKPPTSHFPARPPSELVASFCLVSGGLMFMFSAHNTVTAIEQNGLDAMTIFTITMGLSAAILAWEVVVFSIKGWAVRKERAVARRAVS